MNGFASRLRVALAAISLCLLLPASGWGQDCIDYADFMHWVTRLDVEGACNAVAIGGHHAYLATSSPTLSLQIVDISLPEDPHFVGGVALPNWCQDLAVAGDLAFTANLTNGLQVIDIGDPTAPVVLGSVLTPDAASSVAVHADDMVVVAEWNTGEVFVIDVGDPDSPVILGSALCEDDIRGLEVADGFAYSVYHTPYPGNGGLQIIDLSDPVQPLIVADLATGGWAWDVAVAGDYAYILAGGIIEVYDISEPSTPVLVGVGGHGGRNITVAGDYAYVGSGVGDTGVRVHDISDPTSPTLLGMVRTYDEPRGIAAYGDHVMMANTYSGLNVIDVTVPIQPPIVNMDEDIGSARSQTIADGRAYLSRWANLRIVDLSTPAEPTMIGDLSTEGYVGDVAVDGDFAYMIDDSTGLHVVDVSDPTMPTKIGHWDEGGVPRGLGLSDGHLVVTHLKVQEERTYSLKVLDLSIPEAPVTVGSVSLPYGAWRVTVADQIAYASCSEWEGFAGLVLVDVSDPTAPQQLGSVSLPGGTYNEIVFSGHCAYIATDAYGVQIVDVSDPAQPFVLGNAMSPAASRGISISGDILYVALRESGLAVHDISDPAAPIFLGHTSDEGEAWSVDLWGGYVYMPISGRYQVCYVQCDDIVAIEENPEETVPDEEIPASVLCLTAHPNPFNPQTTITFSLERDERAKVVVYELTGKRVAVLADRIFTSGHHTLQWNGDDSAGRAMPSGTYLVRLSSGSALEARKVSLIR